MGGGILCECGEGSGWELAGSRTWCRYFSKDGERGEKERATNKGDVNRIRCLSEKTSEVYDDC